MGLGGFNDQPAVGPFGTLKKPVLIFSAFKSRAVGCKGSSAVPHRLMWFELVEGPKHVCPDCAQVFKLITPDNYDEADAANLIDLAINEQGLRVPTGNASSSHH